jgi:hypothetical protein
LRVLRLAAFALALCGAPAAVAAPQVELTPAWGGWSRPGRVTEIAVRARSDAAARGAVEIASGAQSVRAALEFAAGDARRLDVAVPSAAALETTVGFDGAPPERRTIALSLSESPLLGVALSSGQAAALEGFHAVALTAGDLPRNAASFSSVDALAIDGTTLRSLEPRQLAALIGHAAGCGRLALVAPDPGAQRLIEGSAGCGARMLVSAATPVEALARLAATLESPAASPATAADLAALVRSASWTWPRVVAALAAFFGIAALSLVLTASTPVLLLMPLLATAVLGALLHAWEPRARLVVWAEAEPSVRVAQYQAWQEVSGSARGRLEVPVLAGLGQPRACDPRRPAQLVLDPGRGQPVHATFDTRLFEPVALCYSGNFPVLRALTITALGGGRVEVRNGGALAWPAGVLAAAGSVQPLPALGPGAAATLSLDRGHPPTDAAERAALARTPYGGYGVLWPLTLDTVADAPAASAAWLLVPVAGPT